MRNLLHFLFSLSGMLFFTCTGWGAADVTVTTVATAAGNLNQGSFTNIIYVARLDVATENLTVSSVQFTLGGTYDNDDLGNVGVYYSTTPTLTGASFAGAVSGAFAAPHAFSIPAGRLISAGTSIYLLITSNINNTATDNHTLLINGAGNPISLTATVPPVITNNQTDIAGVQTIQAADITFTSEAVPDGTLNQGSNTNIIYIAKMDVATEPVTISNVVFNLTGNYDVDDLGNVGIYYSTAPSMSGASFGGAIAGGFAGPHVFSIPAGRLIAAGTTVYVIITTNINTAATDNHIVQINGAIDPITITSATAPNITNNQTNAAGPQTIQAADVTISTVPLPAGSFNPGTNTNIVYIAKLDVTTEPFTTSNIQFNLTGTYDNDDLGNVSVYFSSAPSMAGASFGGGLPGSFDGPHSFNVPAGRVLGAGTTTYVLITVNINSAATDNHTVHIDGGADPITIITGTKPNFINNQTGAAGVQTIQTADIILSTPVLTPLNLLPGSNTNIIYAVKMDVGTQPVTVTSAQLPLNGTYDNDDLGNLNVYYSSSPGMSGASFFGGTAASFNGPHTFTVTGGRSIPANTVAYFLFTVNVNNSATLNNTVSTDGAASPAVFGFTTIPNVANNQSNSAPVFNISNTALPLILQSFSARNAGGQVQLHWVTAAEVNTKNFDIQWSSNGASFNSLGYVAAQGNSQTERHYSFVHASPANGPNYYRLKMIDIDGQFTYSPVVSATVGGPGEAVQAFPNPAVNQLKLVLKNPVPVKGVRIMDISGRTVWQLAAINSTGGIITVPLSGFRSGLYMAEIRTASGVEIISFIKTGN